MSSTSKRSVYQVHPPPMFTHLDHRVSISYGPFTKANAHFCRTMGIERLLNFSGKRIDAPVMEACNVHNIQVHEVNINDQDFPRSSVSKFVQWLNMRVESVSQHASEAPTLLFGSIDNHIATVIAACWRRKAHSWPLSSVFGEFRTLTWPYKLRDYEHVIEHYPGSLEHVVERVSAVTSPAPPPTTSGEGSATPMQPVDRSPSPLTVEDGTEHLTELITVLNSLLTATPTRLVSAAVTFDPAISLVLDKEEDD